MSRRFRGRLIGGIREIVLPDAILYDDPSGGSRIVRLANAALDYDSQPELVLAYPAADGKLRIRVFDVDPSLTPVSIGEATLDLREPDALFDLASGDFDGDDLSEVMVVTSEPYPGDPAEPDKWQLYARIFDFDPEEEMQNRLRPVDRNDADVLFEQDSGGWSMGRLALTAGDLTGDGTDEVAVGFMRIQNGASFFEWILQTIDVGPTDLRILGSEMLQVGSDRRSEAPTDVLAVESADLNADGRAEIVYSATGNAGGIYSLDPQTLAPERIGTVPAGGRFRDGHRFLAIADLDADTGLDPGAAGSPDWRPEIIVASARFVRTDAVTGEGRTFLEIQVLSWDDDEDDLVSRGEWETEVPEAIHSGAIPNLMIAAADFGDRGLRLGPPLHYVSAAITQPLVILNAPPTHFDVFGEEVFDVNDCYGSDPCLFESVFVEEQERTFGVIAEFHRDWAVSTTVDGGFEIPIIKGGVEASLTARYGEHFQKIDGSSQTFTETVKVTARGDDQIYGVTVNYDVWEYPLFKGGERVGHVAVVEPSPATPAFFPSKSWTAHSYRPDHEVGNVLSYSEIAEPSENPALIRSVLWDTGAEVTLTPGDFEFEWKLTREEQTQTEVENEVRMGIEGEVGFDIPLSLIPSVSAAGDYSQSEISTHSIKAVDRQSLSVRLAGLSRGIPDAEYRVTPYVYWARNGALVLDYSVNPAERAGQARTWWQERYGTHPDPAFILPRRLDPEKGILVNPLLRSETKDLLFDPLEPAPGGLLTIKARVHNFSLVPVPADETLAIRFYLGDPASGGLPLINTAGEDAAHINDGIAARGSKTVSFAWAVPGNISDFVIGGFVAVYARIESDEMEEIHESNNLGWAEFRPDPGS